MYYLLYKTPNKHVCLSVCLSVYLSGPGGGLVVSSIYGSGVSKTAYSLNNLSSYWHKSMLRY